MSSQNSVRASSILIPLQLDYLSFVVTGGTGVVIPWRVERGLIWYEARQNATMDGFVGKYYSFVGTYSDNLTLELCLQIMDKSNVKVTLLRNTRLFWYIRV